MVQRPDILDGCHRFLIWFNIRLVDGRLYILLLLIMEDGGTRTLRSDRKRRWRCILMCLKFASAVKRNRAVRETYDEWSMAFSSVTSATNEWTGPRREGSGIPPSKRSRSFRPAIAVTPTCRVVLEDGNAIG